MEQPRGLWLSLTCLSASSGVEKPVCSRLALLWYSFKPFFFELARLQVRAFCRKVLSLFFPLWRSHCLGCYLMLAPSDCPQGSGPVLTLRTNDAARTFPFSPCSWVAHASIWATSPLAVAVRCLFSGLLLLLLLLLLLFNPPSYVALSPQTCL